MNDEEIELALQNCVIGIKENNSFSLALEARIEIKNGKVVSLGHKGLPRVQGDEWFGICQTNDIIDVRTFKRILSYNGKNNVIVTVLYRRPKIGDIWQNTDNNDKLVFIDKIETSRDLIAYSQNTKTIRFFDDTKPMPKRYTFVGKSELNFDNMFNESEDIDEA